MVHTTTDLPDTSRLAVGTLRSRVDERLAAFLAGQAEVLAQVHPSCGPLIEAIADLMSGGKRLRSAFCYWGYLGAGGPEGEGIIAASSALEFFQAAALIHDDVMDASDTRRGRPSVHRRFEALHTSQGWSGDTARFGLAGAVLAGDLCLGWSDQLFSECAADAPAPDLGRAVYTQMRTELMGGQYLDMFAQASAGRETAVEAERLARRVLVHKSAKYSVQQPLLIGAALAGAQPGQTEGAAAGGAATRLRDGYATFGLSLGEAFQLRDDLLGVYGDAAVTGKPAGDDLREGKRTVLVAVAMQRADAHGAQMLDRLLGDPGLDDEGVATLREIITETGARTYVEDLIEGLVTETYDVLAATPVNPEARTMLEYLVDAATTRNA